MMETKSYPVNVFKLDANFMDTELVLNIAVDSASSNRVTGAQKGGRWIDRFLSIHYLFYHLFTSSIQAQSEAVSQEKSQDR
jgi:hypothetical protein